MAVLDLSAYKPVPATLGDANQIANGMQAIQACINALDQNNFAAGKIFDPTKIMQNAAVQGLGLVWDGSQWSPGGVISRIADTLFAVDTGTFDFTAIPQTFKHLMMVVFARNTAAVTVDSLNHRLNNDSAGNYYDEAMSAVAAATTSNEAIAANVGRIGATSGASETALFQGVTVCFWPDYTNANVAKSWVGITAKGGPAAGRAYVAMNGGSWNSNVAISRITLFPGTAASFKAQSRATLLGIS